jgi:hypothetical protein
VAGENEPPFIRNLRRNATYRLAYAKADEVPLMADLDPTNGIAADMCGIEHASATRFGDIRIDCPKEAGFLFAALLRQVVHGETAYHGDKEGHGDLTEQST